MKSEDQFPHVENRLTQRPGPRHRATGAGCAGIVQWTGGYAARFLSVFLALSSSRFDGEPRPTHLPLTLTVRRAHPQKGNHGNIYCKVLVLWKND